MLGIRLRVAICWMLVCAPLCAQSSTPDSRDEAAVWRLEQSYWQYCKAVDLEKYRSLWHPKVLGWPSAFSAPAGKDHIADWLTAKINQGFAMKEATLERLALQVTGNVAVVHYRVKYGWVDPAGKETPAASRITHTWIRVGDGWQIIGGMSAPVDAQGR